MNGTSHNSTVPESDNGLSGGNLFLVVLSATAAWCFFIMCIVCCSEYRGYQRRNINRSCERRNNEGTELKSYAHHDKNLISSSIPLPAIQQDLSTFSPSEDVTDSSIERKDEKSDLFNDIKEQVESSLDFPTPRTRKSILPPISVGTIINVESRCHSDTYSPSKEMLLDSSSQKQRASNMTPVAVNS